MGKTIYHLLQDSLAIIRTHWDYVSHFEPWIPQHSSNFQHVYCIGCLGWMQWQRGACSCLVADWYATGP